MFEPWSKERANEMQSRLAIEAAIVAAHVGAFNVVVIAFYPDGEHMHVLDGGTAPMARSELYSSLATMLQAYEDGPNNGPLQ